MLHIERLGLYEHQLSSRFIETEIYHLHHLHARMFSQTRRFTTANISNGISEYYRYLN
jgi:hypothetical protein